MERNYLEVFLRHVLTYGLYGTPYMFNQVPTRRQLNVKKPKTSLPAFNLSDVTPTAAILTGAKKLHEVYCLHKSK